MNSFDHHVYWQLKMAAFCRTCQMYTHNIKFIDPAVIIFTCPEHETHIIEWSAEIKNSFLTTDRLKELLELIKSELGVIDRPKD